jgi:uncharacterized surface protein with fasciclin (FAS1) repeats/plastocyanin
MKKLSVILMILFVGILIAGCTTKPAAPVATPAPTPVPTPVPTTVPAPEARGCYAIIADDPQFSVLATAIKAAKLDTALNGPGQVTIFAPTDDAFNSLPAGTVATLLKDPEGQLKQILLNHVVDGRILKSVDVVKLGEAKTMQGAVLVINTTDGVTIGGAKVTKTDIVCTNGVIHVINRVLIPPVTVKTATPTPTPAPTPIPDQKVYVAKTLTFNPNVLTVPVGTKVVWWTDAVGYKFNVGLSGSGVNTMVGIITPTTTGSYTFTKAGTYSMSEMIYPQFRDDESKIVVT